MIGGFKARGATHSSNEKRRMQDQADLAWWSEKERCFILTVAICGQAVLESAPSVEAPAARLRPNYSVFRVPQYKFFGPYQGVLYGRYDLLDRLQAYKVRPAEDQPAAAQIRDRHAEPRGAGGDDGGHRLPGSLGGRVRCAVCRAVP
jgi:hypothetical protein